jgi:acyl carrier protein
VIGELYLGGVGLARGYLNRSALTASRFLPDPFGAEAGGRLYRTGDLASYFPDGALEFRGRRDLQVKIRGTRVELEGVESVLRQHPSVRESAVLAQDVGGRPGERRLLAYVVASDPRRPPSLAELREFLLEHLPDYVVPTAVALVPALPRTAGKVDRRALAELATSGPNRQADYVAPRNPVEDVLADFLGEALRVENLGVQEDIFDLGADSLLAIRVHARLRSAFGLNFPMSTFLGCRTVADLAQQMVARESQPGRTEKIARAIQQVRDMDAEEVRQALQNKSPSL